MKTRPRIGLTGEHTFIVEPKHVIEFAGDGMPAVLSTPNLIGLLERTARQTLVPLLEANERTVGAEIELRHLAPTPLGARVTREELSALARQWRRSTEDAALPPD
jgi:predicted thioesterase